MELERRNVPGEAKEIVCQPGEEEEKENWWFRGIAGVAAGVAALILPSLLIEYIKSGGKKDGVALKMYDFCVRLSTTSSSHPLTSTS